MKRAHHKYGAKPVTVDGRRYDSKAEAAYADGLRAAQSSGELVGWLEQVPLHLQGGVVYRLDFLEFWSNGRVVAVDVKGMETPVWKVKWKQAKAAYPWLAMAAVKRRGKSGWKVVDSVEGAA